MNLLLSRLASQVRDRPRVVLLVAALVTVVLATFASRQTMQTELTAFAPDSAVTVAFDRIRDDFGGGGESLQVIVDAGDGGDVWTAEGLAVAGEVESALAAVLDDRSLSATVSSFAGPLRDQLAADGIAPEAADDAEIAAAARSAWAEPLAVFSPVQVDLEAGRAPAGLVIVSLPSDLGPAEVDEASRALAAGVGGLGGDGIDVSPFNAFVLQAELEASAQDEMPMLLGLSLLVILAILSYQYRTVSDVVIGLAGLIASIVWITGIAVLLGPSGLGLVGPFSQIATIVPVLLVGLGIDYSIHITTRYREERSLGAAPNRSSAMAVRTVGGALVLATITTVVGFLTNLASPLPPLADFGVFTAVGVVSAFVIMTAVVPAARNIVDTRRVAKGRHRASPRPAVGLARLIARTSILAERAPRRVLAVALGVSLVAAVAATQVSTTFSQDDFIPDGSEVDRLLDRMHELFAGEVAETTYVLVDGDLTDVAVLAAIDELAPAVSELDGVRTSGGAAQVTSPATAIAGLARGDDELAGRLAALGWTVDGFAHGGDAGAMLDLLESEEPALYDGLISPERSSGIIAIGTRVGQDGAAGLADELDPLLEPLRSTGIEAIVTSEALVLDEAFDALTASQARGIAITLVAALVLLVTYYGFVDRKPLLGVITMIPSLAVVAWVLATMWLLGISFNVLTAMVASLGIGIGVPFGIHVTHRFLEDRRRFDTVDEALRTTVFHTGGAMAGSAATTAGGFGVLILASLEPMRQFGTIIAITIVFSFVAAVIVQPSCLKLWAEARARRGDTGVLLDHERRDLAGLPSPGGPAVTGNGSDADVPVGAH